MADSGPRGRAGALALCAGLALAGGAGCGAGCGAGEAGADLSGHNLLLVSIDTLRADRTSPYGRDIETPALQRLADEGLLFELALSPVPLTQPAHTSLFTGNYPGRHGVRDNISYALGPEALTLFEAFRSAGYQTGAVVAATVLARRSGLDQGFESYDDQLGGDLASSSLPVVERGAAEIRDRARAWLDARDGGRPFALFLHFYDPHLPYAPPPDIQARYPGRRYDGEVMHVDRCLGGVLEHLERLDLLERTLVVVLSDHGESLREHGEQEHGLFLYEPVVRIPLVLRFPAGTGPRGRRLATPVSLIDVMPTLLELYGLPAPPMDGVSLAPLLRGETPAPRDHFAETHYPLFYRWSPSTSVRRGRHKYIHTPEAELYDVEVDPAEARNLLAELPELAGELEGVVRAQLARWAEQAGAAEQADSLQSLEAMAALGYTGGAAVDPEVAGTLPDAKQRVGIYLELSDAMRLMAARRWPEARARFEDLARRDPENPSVHLNLGQILANMGELGRAEGHLRTCLDLAPRNTSAKATLGSVLFGLQRVDEAAALFEEILAEAPKTPEPLYFLGQVHELRGEPRRALERYEAAYALLPGLPGLEQRIQALRRQLGGG